MNEVTGSLHLLSVRELMVGIEARSKTGVLTIRRDETEKTFYLRDGKVIFVTSNKPGERFAEFLSGIGCMDRERLLALVRDSQRRGARFTADLLAENVFKQKELETALGQLVVIALADALDWAEGEFVFFGKIPDQVLRGPIQVEVEHALGLAEGRVQGSAGA